MGGHRKKARQAEMHAAREATRRVADSDAAVVAHLRALDPPELAQLFRRVFAGNPPSAGRVECDRGVLYLGYAWSSWAHTPAPGEPPEWGEWATGAVAYRPTDDIRSGLGAALHNETTCPGCRTHLWSNDSLMVCPVCGWDAVAELDKARRTRRCT